MHISTWYYLLINENTCYAALFEPGNKKKKIQKLDSQIQSNSLRCLKTDNVLRVISIVISDIINLFFEIFSNILNSKQLFLIIQIELQVEKYC